MRRTECFGNSCFDNRMEQIIDLGAKRLRKKAHDSKTLICYFNAQQSGRKFMDLATPRERVHFEDGLEMQLRSGSILNLPVCDLGGNHFLISARPMDFPFVQSPISGLHEEQIAQLWKKVAEENKCWTFSERNATETWDELRVSVSHFFDIGLLDVIESDGLLIMSPGRILRWGYDNA